LSFAGAGDAFNAAPITTVVNHNSVRFGIVFLLAMNDQEFALSIRDRELKNVADNRPSMRFYETKGLPGRPNQPLALILAGPYPT
jgi:hypothetical protein